LNRKGEDIIDIAVFDRQRARPETDARGEHKKNYEPYRKQKQAYSGLDAVGDHDDGHEGCGDGKVEESRGDSRKWQNKTGKVDFSYEVCVADEATVCAVDRACEEGPEHQAGICKREVRHTTAIHFGDFAKNEAEDSSAKEGLEYHPDDAEDGLLVAHANIPAGKSK